MDARNQEVVPIQNAAANDAARSQSERASDAFLRRLREGPVLADGAMGTELYRRASLPADSCLEQLNLTRPDLVRQVHLDYIAAGAEVIETNTFGANRVRLGAYGLADRVAELNRAAAALAQEAQRLTGQRVWVAGAIGPLGRPLAPLGAISAKEARDAFREQAEALAEAGVDLVILETFPSLAEIGEAIAAVREAAPDLPIVAQLTFNQDGHTLANETPEDVAAALAPLGLAAVGGNCSVGSDHLLGVIERLAAAGLRSLSALPNAGFPATVNGRLVYLSSPAYMAERAGWMLDAGASVIGGCCGTTPEHVAAMREMLRHHRERHPREGAASGGTASASPTPSPGRAGPPAKPVYPPQEPTDLAKKLRRREFVFTVEVHPPRGFHIEKTLADLRRLLARVEVDAFNCTDAPLAQGRVSALAMSSLLQSRLGVEAIMHVATRYRNMLALQADLLGAHALGVRNLFVFMGDPPSMGDYPTTVSFSDVTSSGLIRLIAAGNRGEDQNGKPIEEPTNFLVGCALNLESQDMDRELESLKRKVDAGADFILSQVVFDAASVERVHDRLGGFPVPLILGVLPLRSARHAEFLHNEVPGMVIPDEVRRRMQEAGDKGLAMGVTLAQELITRVRDAIAGAYLIPSFGRYDAIADLIEGLPVSPPARP